MIGSPKNLLVSGRPGIGKTSLIKEATLPYRDRLGGFYTEELRDGGVRMGFRLVALDGAAAVLASKALASPLRINKYGVDLAVLDGIGVRAVEEAAAAGRVVVIDELGAMEALSGRFRAAALSCLTGPARVLATLRTGTRDFADQARLLPGSRMLVLERRNYREVLGEVTAWLKIQLG